MMKSKLMIALPVMAVLAASMPQVAEARTKSIVKYGAIGLGAVALSQMAQQNRYYSQPYYGGYYNSYPSYNYGYSSGYYYPNYSYGYGYSQPSYGYYGSYYGY